MNTITISAIPDYLAQDLGRYQKATIASIRAFAEAQLKPNARVVVYGIPGKPDLGPDVPTPKTLQKGKIRAEKPSTRTLRGARTRRNPVPRAR